jgi:hypothetical protein
MFPDHNSVCTYNFLRVCYMSPPSHSKEWGKVATRSSDCDFVRRVSDVVPWIWWIGNLRLLRSICRRVRQNASCLQPDWFIDSSFVHILIPAVLFVVWVRTLSVSMDNAIFLFVYRRECCFSLRHYCKWGREPCSQPLMLCLSTFLIHSQLWGIEHR